MARARNIKPALFKNEVLGQADPILTLLFVGLWTLADKRGRLEDRPLRIKAEIFPYREGLDINVYLTELERLEFIDRYEVDRQKIIQVLTFSKHQNPHKTEKESVLPEKPEKTTTKELTVKEPLKNGEVTEAAGLIPDSCNTDSLVLIPDITDAPLSPFKTPGCYLKHLISEHGYNEMLIRRKQQHTTQARQWLLDGVTAAELDHAVAASRKQLEGAGDTNDPPVAYLAKVIASGRKSRVPVAAGNHTGFSQTNYRDDPALSRFKISGGGL